MISPIKTALILLISLVSTLNAETEKEFLTRVHTAWQSNDSTKVMALYGPSLKEDSEIYKNKAAKVETELKTRNFTSAQIVPFGPVEEGPRIIPGQMVFMPKVSQFLAIEMTSKDPKITGTVTQFLPIVKNQDETFSLATPKVTPFTWEGPTMESFQINLKASTSATLPPVIVVFETCGYTSFMKMEGPVCALGAHKILQLILPPLEGGGTVSIEISKQNQEGFYKKTVDATKGSIVMIEASAP